MKSVMRKSPSRLSKHMVWYVGNYVCAWSVRHYTNKNAMKFIDVRMSMEIIHDYNDFQMQTEQLFFFYPELWLQANMDL